jgi:hypothetical protein
VSFDPLCALVCCRNASDRSSCARARPSLLKFLRSSPGARGRRAPARAAPGSR